MGRFQKTKDIYEDRLIDLDILIFETLKLIKNLLYHILKLKRENFHY